MNTFFKLTALAGLLAIAGHAFAVDDITRVDQIPVLKEEPQHATVSERVTSRFTRSHYRQFDLDNAFTSKNFRPLSESAGLQPQCAVGQRYRSVLGEEESNRR